MKLIDRYLFMQFAKNLLLVLCSLVAIYLLVDFFERIDNFLEAKKTMGLAVQYFLLKIPLIYEQLTPVCILLAGVITLGVLNHNHEFMALTASGICVGRIVRPLLAATCVFTLLTLAASQWLLPATITATDKIWYEEVNRQIPRGITREGRTYYKGKTGFYSFIRPSADKNRFIDFSYAAWDDEHQLTLLLSARTASWQDGVWTFTDGQIKVKDGGQDYRVSLFKKTAMDLAETPEDFFVPPYKIKEMPLSDLFREAWENRDDQNSSAWLEFNKRLSYIFLGFPLVLIGLPILLSMHRTRGRDLALAVTVSCGMAFIAWGLWSASQSMAKAELVHPALASWAIHFVAGGLGIFLIRRQDH